MDCVVWQVSASKTKIYMVLEYVNGGELFDKIVRIMDLPNLLHFGRNVLVDAKGNIKISDFGLSALPQHLGVCDSNLSIDFLLIFLAHLWILCIRMMDCYTQHVEAPTTLLLR
ncbi:hypothetical protein B296_00026474 [Ensete ventricosum]|uniref:Protein kinase domain-containing protein n=1 Tax=Ensete ventricosum TaxID=4639 RepID=A0A426ZPK9_ENSVE|nr:hypothetical protein B296_00026474 [Ensete ventricosum]